MATSGSPYQLIGELCGDVGFARHLCNLCLLVELRRHTFVARLVVAPLLPAEDTDQADGDAGDYGQAVLTQPFLNAFALFIVVVFFKCHAFTVQEAAYLLAREDGRRGK